MLRNRRSIENSPVHRSTLKLSGLNNHIPGAASVSPERMRKSPIGVKEVVHKISMGALPIFPQLPAEASPNQNFTHSPLPKQLIASDSLKQLKQKRREIKPGQLVLISRQHKLEKKFSLKKINKDMFTEHVLKKSNSKTISPRKEEQILPDINQRLPQAVERKFQTPTRRSISKKQRLSKVNDELNNQTKSHRSTLEIHMQVHEQSLFSPDKQKKASRAPSSESYSTHGKFEKFDSGRLMGDGIGIGTVHPKLEHLTEFNNGNVSQRSDSLASYQVKNKIYTLKEAL